ncbi:MAG TPA: DUF389 domain-containing protein [Candidatus Baltobacteraceae bacterium]|nr:DUF389 domain-containing protein [Candidatus Baltobacteraceae bacterium]
MNDARGPLVEDTSREARLDRPFVALAAASCAIATFGLLANSAAVIIGAMLIAPLMTPIVSLAFALVRGSVAVARRAIATLAVGAALSIAMSAVLARLVDLALPGSEILARSHPNLLDLGVALAAGAIAGYARVRSTIAASVGGAAIAVALMPPLCVVGIGAALGQRELAYGALLLFTTNFVGITFACAAVFALAGFATHHARGAIVTAALLVGVVAVPLAFATVRLIEQSRVEAVLRQALVTDTVTFKRVLLLSASVDWLASPIRVELLVRSSTPVTPTQVSFLQAFAERRVGRPLTLVVDVSPVQTVTAASPSPPAAQSGPAQAPPASSGGTTAP